MARMRAPAGRSASDAGRAGLETRNGPKSSTLLGAWVSGVLCPPRRRCTRSAQHRRKRLEHRGAFGVLRLFFPLALRKRLHDQGSLHVARTVRHESTATALSSRRPFCFRHARRNSRAPPWSKIRVQTPRLKRGLSGGTVESGMPFYASLMRQRVYEAGNVSWAPLPTKRATARGCQRVACNVTHLWHVRCHVRPDAQIRAPIKRLFGRPPHQALQMGPARVFIWREGREPPRSRSGKLRSGDEPASYWT